MNKLNRKGFTLIELLAVLTILAIIAVIIVPIVTDNIDEAEKASTIESGNNLIKAVEMYMVSSKQGYGSIDVLDSNLVYNGDKPEFGEVEINSKGRSKMYAYMNGYCLTKTYTGEVTATKTDKEDCKKIYDNGEVVYFNVTSGATCTSSEAVSTTGTKSGCMKFYAFNDEGETTVNLLLDHNTTATALWNSSGSNASGPSEVLTQLKSDTSAWVGTETPSNYTNYNGTTAKYTIDYSSYKARLITVQEIATITGNTGWDEKLSTSYSYYFDSKTTSASTTCTEGNTTGCQYGWLYDRTSEFCTTYGCLNNSDSSTYGYWTASSRASSSFFAWYVDCFGFVIYDDVDRVNVGYDDVGNDLSSGVRPVITVLKSKLS